MSERHARVVIRTLTWNIHGALWKNLRFEAERVIALIAEANADVIALQEVDSRRGEDCFSLLLQRLGKHGVNAKSIITNDGD